MADFYMMVTLAFNELMFVKRNVTNIRTVG